MQIHPLQPESVEYQDMLVELYGVTDTFLSSAEGVQVIQHSFGSEPEIVSGEASSEVNIQAYVRNIQVFGNSALGLIRNSFGEEAVESLGQGDDILPFAYTDSSSRIALRNVEYSNGDEVEMLISGYLVNGVPEIDPLGLHSISEVHDGVQYTYQLITMAGMVVFADTAEGLDGSMVSIVDAAWDPRDFSALTVIMRELSEG